MKQLSSAGPSSENLNRLSPKNDSDGKQSPKAKKKLRRKKTKKKSLSPDIDDDEQARLEAEMRRRLKEESNKLKNMFQDNLRNNILAKIDENARKGQVGTESPSQGSADGSPKNKKKNLFKGLSMLDPKRKNSIMAGGGGMSVA